MGIFFKCELFCMGDNSFGNEKKIVNGFVWEITKCE